MTAGFPPSRKLNRQSRQLRNPEDPPDPPDKELGRGVPSTYDYTGGMQPWGMWVDDVERAPDLQWPRSVSVYDNMSNDAQCQGLFMGATAAIQRYSWYVEPNDCDPSYVEALAADLNLPVGLDAAKQAALSGTKRGVLSYQRRAGWYAHLRLALKALQYGYYYFEQVGEIQPNGPGGKEIWRLKKLGPRHPRTITEIWIGYDGNLLLVKQGWGEGMPGKPSTAAPEIPIDRLVCYVWDQEPGNWTGRSIFRPMYRNWLVKDRLLRVDAIKHERNGVGMPIVNAPEGATRADIQDLDRMAQEYKAGERGGGALPYGAKLTLQGTQGALPDTIASIRFQNEEMARSMLMMFFQLGQTESGSRALGQTFIDWFTLQQEMIADWICDTAVPYIIADWWGWNVDPNAEQTPLLGYYKGDEGQPDPQQDFGPAADAVKAALVGEASAPSSAGREGGPFQSRPQPRVVRAAAPPTTPQPSGTAALTDFDEGES